MSEANDQTTTLQELKDLVADFRDERNWAKHHSPKNLAMSIAIEAAELMEHFQWDEYTIQKKAEIADELSDVLLYSFNLADTLGIDISRAYRDKLARAKKKFPTELFNAEHDSPEEYARIKKAYRQGKKR